MRHGSAAHATHGAATLPPACGVVVHTPLSTSQAHALSVLATDVDLVWANVDHQALLWRTPHAESGRSW